MRFPQIQIQSAAGKIGIRSDSGQFDIKQPSATLDIQSVNTIIDVKSTQPQVLIDNSKTWDAVTGGKPESFWNRIYNQYGQFVQRAIERTIDEYDQIGDIPSDSNPIADVAMASMFSEPPKKQIYGYASPNNIKFEAVIVKPEITITPGYSDINVTVNKPQIEFHKGGVQVYMEQYSSVNITAPFIDLTV